MQNFTGNRFVGVVPNLVVKGLNKLFWCFCRSQIPCYLLSKIQCENGNTIGALLRRIFAIGVGYKADIGTSARFIINESPFQVLAP